jgi:hypothetical protein
MLQKRIFSVLCLTIAFTFILSDLPVGGTVAAQTPVSGCPPFNPAMAEDPGFLKSLPPECLEQFKTILKSREKMEVEAQAISPGPDDYGYTSEFVTYDWISGDTPSDLAGDDDYDIISTNFSFPFYEAHYNSATISANGLILLGFTGSMNQGWPYGDSIPRPRKPNSFIAPFWEDLVVGSPYNTGAVYYRHGGVFPNQYLVVEWRDVTYYWDPSTPFSFEVILYENGNVVLQYQSVPSNYYWTAVGIENNEGMDGLQYHYGSSTGLSAGMAIRFNRPTTPTARVKVNPLIQGAFSATTGSTTFSFAVRNTGTNGTDTYDFLGSPSWTMSLYVGDGVTLLTDTDSDGYVDTGPLPQNGWGTFQARFSPPIGASVGDSMSFGLTVRSSVDVSKSEMVVFQLSIPTKFANVYENYIPINFSLIVTENFFMLANPGGTSVYDIGTKGYDPVVARTANGSYIYLWDDYYCCWNISYPINIGYEIVGSDGSVIRAPVTLHDNSGASLLTHDYVPAVAVTPVGTMGITWLREVYNPANDKYNYNILFEVLDPSGIPTYGPVNVTNNSIWGSFNTGDLLQFYSPTIAATSDNRFVLAWTRLSGPSNDENVWYAVYTHAAGLVKSAMALTTDNNSWLPSVNTLRNGSVIFTWQTWQTLSSRYLQNYAVINSSGNAVKNTTTLSTAANEPWENSDAVALPNGNIAVGWISEGYNLTFAILDPTFNLAAGPTTTTSVLPILPYLQENQGLSMTTDYLSRVIFTWGETSYKALFHAVGDSTGGFLSPALAFLTPTYNGGSYTEAYYPSLNGQGNAAVTTFADISPEYWSWNYIERLSLAGITGGCGTSPLIYCSETAVSRGQMAVFLERGMNSSSYTPPAATGTVFGDVPTSYWSASWVEKLFADGITGGCGGGNYCPDLAVSRAQMAVFLLRAKHGSSYTPPPATGVFPDVPTSYWAAPWIEQLYAESITGGCGGGNYCPDQSVTRGQMAVFLVRTFGLP